MSISRPAGRRYTQNLYSMSKGNMLLGHARGKVGSLVFSRSNGQQVVRARAEVVKNPQTETQMVQRIILNTIAQAYSRMSEIVDHSFEGVAPGLASMAYFNSKNMDALRNKIKIAIAAGETYDDVVAFSPLNSATFCPNSFLIAKGTLPEIVAENVGGYRAAMPSVAGNTYADVIAAYGLERGDQLTFVTINGSYANGTSFHFARVILDPINADMTEADLSVPFISDGAINLPNGRNEGEFNTLEFDTDKVVFSLTQRNLLGCAIIVSRKNSDGTWKRSRASINAYDDNIIGFFPSLQECLDALADNGLDALNARYLNNAGVGRLQNQEVPTPTTTIASATWGGQSVPAGGTLSADTQDAAVVVTLSDVGDEKVGVFKMSGSTPDSLATPCAISGNTATGNVTGINPSDVYGIGTYVGTGSSFSDVVIFGQIECNF